MRKTNAKACNMPLSLEKHFENVKKNVYSVGGEKRASAVRRLKF